MHSLLIFLASLVARTCPSKIKGSEPFSGALMEKEQIASSLNAGDHSTKMSSRWGELVRTVVPISFNDWRAVPQEKNDELWKQLQIGKHNFKKVIASKIKICIVLEFVTARWFDFLLSPWLHSG
ncbi:hypothetical protein AAC387_Pa07g2522 [Persea americana]